jgi:hypothetical protein
VNADNVTMNLIISLLSGFITALIGITPPGLLNMTAAKVNLKEKKCLLVRFRAVIIIFFKPTCDIVCSCDRYPSRYSDFMREVGLVYLRLYVLFFLL